MFCNVSNLLFHKWSLGKNKFSWYSKFEWKEGNTNHENFEAFFDAKQIIIERVMFSVTDGTNAMKGKKGGLQMRIHYSPFNIYANCCNHYLVLFLPHMKNKKFSNMLAEYDTLLLGLWKMFHYSLKKGPILGLIQHIYGKKPLRIWKATTMWW